MSLTGGNPFSGAGAEAARAGDGRVGHPPELGRQVAEELPNFRNLPVPTAADFPNSPGALSILNHQINFFDSAVQSPSDAANWMSSKGQGAEAAANILGTVMNGFKDLGAGFAGQDQPPPPEQQQNNEYADAAQRNAQAAADEQKRYQEAEAASAAA
jgi:hypothetical protein